MINSSLGTIRVSWSDENGKSQNAFLVTFDQKRITDPKNKVPIKLMKQIATLLKMKVIK